QEITLQFQALEEWHEITVPIVGMVDYFPTLDPRNEPFVIANIDPLFEAVGTQLPHNFWVSYDGEVDLATIQQQVRDLGYPVLRWQDPATELEAARAQPARRGVLGFLSIGFVAAIALTLVMAVIQTTASFRAQAVQIGALRAMGLGGGAVG